MVYRCIFLILILLLGYSSLAQAESNKSATKQFISMSDIHFDPMQGCERFKSPCPILLELIKTPYQSWDNVFNKYVADDPIKYHLDTNYSLLKSTFTELGRIAKESHPEFVLVLGDFLDHQLEKNYRKYSKDSSHSSYTQFVKMTMQYLAYKLNQALPTTDIYPALGNVDTYDNDYSVVPNGIFLHDLSDIWASLIKNPANKRRFLAEFHKGGYYAVDLGEKGKLIVLDTVLFSPRSQTADVKQAARQELAWLEEQLQSARKNHQAVLFACHIPVGIDIYFTSSIAYKIIKNFWKNEYSKRFVEILKEYSDLIVAVLPGHVHIDLFQFTIAAKDNKQIPMIFTPSISPIFGNNPAIKEFTYATDTLQLQSFERYYNPISEPKEGWHKGNRYNAIYQSNCQYCYLKDVMIHLVVNNYLLNFFTRLYTGNQEIGQHGDWYSYWCSIYSSDMRTYRNCVNE